MRPNHTTTAPGRTQGLHPARIWRKIYATGLTTLVVALAAAVTIGTVPAGAITDGQLDGNGHPAVVLLVMDVDGTPAFRCSATLLSATVVLTAGHCAGEPGEFSSMRVFTESDVENGNNNYPFAGPNAVEARSWQSHPEFGAPDFFLHDVGVVLLKQPGVVLPASQYGVLPKANQLDALKPSARPLRANASTSAPRSPDRRRVHRRARSLPSGECRRGTKSTAASAACGA